MNDPIRRKAIGCYFRDLPPTTDRAMGHFGPENVSKRLGRLLNFYYKDAT
jgi:hypothetical protein